MKILYVTTGLAGGGAEKVVADLADRMADLGHQVKIAYLKGDIVVRPQNREIELVYLGLEGIAQVQTAYKNYKKLILSFNPDVVHSHMVHANIFARISRKFTPVPKLICTAHSNNEGGKLRMLAYRFTHSYSDLLTNVSSAAAENFIALGAAPKDGIRAVYNGINLKKFKHLPLAKQKIRQELAISDQALLFLAVGRLNEAKDYPNLLTAFSQYVQQTHSHFESKLIIVGEGEQRAAIEQLIQELNLSSQVSLLGRRDDIPELMSAADYFVLSSSFEGFGLVVAEAMACETFVIATDCGGVKEVMGGFGLICKPEDSQALAQSLVDATKITQQEHLLNNQRALRYVQENFDLDRIIEKWLAIYEC